PHPNGRRPRLLRQAGAAQAEGSERLAGAAGAQPLRGGVAAAGGGNRAGGGAEGAGGGPGAGGGAAQIPAARALPAVEVGAAGGAGGGRRGRGSGRGAGADPRRDAELGGNGGRVSHRRPDRGAAPRPVSPSHRDAPSRTGRTAAQGGGADRKSTRL